MAKFWYSHFFYSLATVALAACSFLLEPSSLAGEPLSAAGTSPSATTMKVAVKYVALKASTDQAAKPSREAVQTLVSQMNQIWSQCQVQFVLEQYETPVADDAKVLYAPSDLSDLEEDRRIFDDGKHALIVKTGTWDRSGTLGDDGSNGWSTMPPSSPEGLVVEEPVGVNPTLVTHESGHLVGGLDHVSDETNLMDHFVSPDSRTLTANQCADARDTIERHHKAWLR